MIHQDRHLPFDRPRSLDDETCEGNVYMGLKIETLDGKTIGEIGGAGRGGSLSAEGGVVYYYPKYQDPLARFEKAGEFLM